MHYYLADRAARLKEPGARALMLDAANHVTEASTANLVLYYRGEGLVSPPKEHILPWISVEALADIARNLGERFSYRIVTVDDVARADEVFLTSTSPCMVPCVRLNGRPIGTGTPGEAFHRLMSAWNKKVGIQIIEQAERFAGSG
jgi:branched-subunit amino acid aminotransferase/4-amino-4-deoxychorismate lyase